MTTNSCTANVWVLYVCLELVKVWKVFSNFIQVVNFLDFCQNIKKSHKLKLIWKVLSRTFDKKKFNPWSLSNECRKSIWETLAQHNIKIFFHPINSIQNIFSQLKKLHNFIILLDPSLNCISKITKIQ